MIRFTQGLLTASAFIGAYLATVYALDGFGIHPALACTLTWAAGASLAIPKS